MKKHSLRRLIFLIPSLLLHFCWILIAYNLFLSRDIPDIRAEYSLRTIRLIKSNPMEAAIKSNTPLPKRSRQGKKHSVNVANVTTGFSLRPSKRNLKPAAPVNSSPAILAMKTLNPPAQDRPAQPAETQISRPPQLSPAETTIPAAIEKPLPWTAEDEKISPAYTAANMLGEIRREMGAILSADRNMSEAAQELNPVEASGPQHIPTKLAAVREQKPPPAYTETAQTPQADKAATIAGSSGHRSPETNIIRQPGSTIPIAQSVPRQTLESAPDKRLAYIDHNSGIRPGGNSSTPALPLPPIEISLEQELEASSAGHQPLSVTDSSFKLKGRLNQPAETAFITLNEQVQQLDTGSVNLEAEVTLKPGLNSIKLQAMDNLGRYAAKDFTVIYTPLDIYRSGDWTTYINDALAQNRHIYAIVSDKSGNKWFGTDGGVIKFSGSNWTKYTPAHGLPAYHVLAVATDNSGRLWAGTDGGVSYFDGYKWVSYNQSHGLPSDRVNAVVCDASGRIWAGTQAGISLFDGQKWQSFTVRDGLPHNQINAIAVDKSGRVWAGTQAGAAVYDGQKWATALKDNTVNAIAVDNKGRVWFATRQGVSCLDGQDWKNYSAEDGLNSGRVNAVAIDKGGNPWFGTDYGVSRLSRNGWTQYSYADGLAANQVNAVYVESSDRIWFGTSRGITELNTRYAGHFVKSTP